MLLINQRALVFLVLIFAVPANVLADGFPKNLRKQIEDHLIGTWNYKMKSTDIELTGTMTAKWSEGNHCIVISKVAESPHGVVHETGILAWQPDLKKVVRTGYISNGDYYTNTYDEFDFKSNKWSGTVSGIINGKRPVPATSPSEIKWSKDRIDYKDNVFTLEAQREINQEK